MRLLLRRVLESNPNLRIIANHAVGYNNIDIDAARELGITVTNTPGVLTELQLASKTMNFSGTVLPCLNTLEPSTLTGCRI